jgi:hypothetical protein
MIVDLPAPEGPTIPIIFFAGIDIFIWLSTFLSLFG